jgi:ribosome-associated translation inhibitor RaiA
MGGAMTETMRIEIKGTRRDTALRAHASERLRAALVPLKVAPISAQASFVDDNGPKGGLALRCALTVQVPYRPTIRVEQTAETGRLAFDAAMAALERRLERYREEDRDRRRHPKKYYAAKRLSKPRGTEGR